MKKGRILNIQLNKAIASLGHLDWIIISDAGLPVDREEQRIDLAIEAGKPEIAEILELVTSDLIYERCIVAKEQEEYNPLHFANVKKIITRCKVETIPHEALLEYKKKAKYIIRTGGFEPWGNVVLCCGVDAPVWFQKEGVITPDYYSERANYKEEKN
ncbi:MULTISPECIES: D-ribose pyranase [Treponema]|uniref:D-ribose pyranase n=1 Tax=Treponema TaxID=157 RepID=UPI0019618EFF|nr:MULTISPECIES: D-ribose pyranase [Treponema]MBM7023891.1 D-ribose pyranase [Treponema sp. Marseille-Q4523]MDR9858292.1 D-ribose pyranase [Treponema socranskii]